MVDQETVLKLSKTRVRQNAFRLAGAEGLEPAPLSSLQAPCDRIQRVYAALHRMASDCPGVGDFNWGGHRTGDQLGEPEWVRLFERYGIPLKTLKKQRVAWLADEAEAARRLLLRFSKPTLVTAGILDPDGEFRFARHRILIPFRQAGEAVYLAGLDPEAGFSEIRTPTPHWPIPYRIPSVEPIPTPHRLYLTTELATAFRLGTLGLSVWTVSSAGMLSGEPLEPLKGREVVLCLNRPALSQETIQPFSEILEPICRRFWWQTLSQAETHWVLVQSREERGQMLQQSPRGRQPEAKWLSRVVKAFRRRNAR